MMGKKIIAFGMTLAFMLMSFPSVSLALEQESVAALPELPEGEGMLWTQSDVMYGSHSEPEGNGELSERYTSSGSRLDTGTPEQPFTAAAPRELAMTTAAAGVWLTVPGIVGGQICFHASTGTITGCDRSVTVADIPKTIDGVRVTSIGSDAFEYCNNLTSVTIPDSVEKIRDYAFAYCTNIASISIPNSVESIGIGTFVGCIKLTAFNVNTGNGNYVAIDGVLFNKSHSRLISYPAGREGAYLVPSFVESIGPAAFDGCVSLTNITIPDSVESIGIGAFSYCTNLMSVTIGNSVESIGRSAFDYCTSLISVTIGHAVKYIGDSAFTNCTNLTNLTIPDSVESIGNRVFVDCSKLTEINVNDANSYYTSVDGVLFNKTCTELLTCPCGRVGAYSAPDSVVSIEHSAFLGCTNLTSVTIPESVNNIGDYAFSGCTNIESATIPSSVGSIGSQAFEWCEKLTNVTIPNSVESISRASFLGCTNLTSVTIPDSVENIGDYAFCRCTVTVNPVDVFTTS